MFVLCIVLKMKLSQKSKPERMVWEIQRYLNPSKISRTRANCKIQILHEFRIYNLELRMKLLLKSGFILTPYEI